MRGTRSADCAKCIPCGIIPAHAGNTVHGTASMRASGDHPRACGEHIFCGFAYAGISGSSPRMRGTHDLAVDLHVPVGIIPAHAGNTRPPCTPPPDSRDHPRACGEHVSSGVGERCSRGSSPRMRGTPQRKRTPRPHGRDHPRACGEHGETPYLKIDRPGSSPRMRGTLLRAELGLRIGRIIPAHAGNTPDIKPILRKIRGIIPAHAGNTMPYPHYLLIFGDHPRACGEHLLRLIQQVANEGSSPRMRGTLSDRNDMYLMKGIIPAHAGNTL